MNFPDDHINKLETLVTMMEQEIIRLKQIIDEAKKGINIPQRKDIEKSFDEMVMRRNITRDKKTYAT